MSVLEEIQAERLRQIELGFTASHDKQHTSNELSRAAACYAWPNPDETTPPSGWPWKDEEWKPKDQRQNLLRAAALIVAEIERMDLRTEPRQPLSINIEIPEHVGRDLQALHIIANGLTRLEDADEPGRRAGLNWLKSYVEAKLRIDTYEDLRALLEPLAALPVPPTNELLKLCDEIRTHIKRATGVISP